MLQTRLQLAPSATCSVSRCASLLDLSPSNRLSQIVAEKCPRTHLQHAPLSLYGCKKEKHGADMFTSLPVCFWHPSGMRVKLICDSVSHLTWIMASFRCTSGILPEFFRYVSNLFYTSGRAHLLPASFQSGAFWERGCAWGPNGT